MSGAVSETLSLAVGRETSVLAAWGIAPPKRGHMLCPFPDHPDRSPSWRFDLHKGDYFCTCGSGSLIDVAIRMGVAHDPLSAAQSIRDVLGLEPLGKRREETPPQARAERLRKNDEALAKAQELGRRREAEAEAHAKAQRVKCLRMWLHRRKPAEGSIVQTYFRSRGITCPVPSTIAFLPPDKLSHHPAMMTAFGTPNEPEPGNLLLPPACLAGLHLTLLRPDGSGKAPVENAKLTIGPGHSMPIVVAPPNDLGGLIIAEGIEDALSAHQETGLGAWPRGRQTVFPALPCICRRTSSA